MRIPGFSFFRRRQQQRQARLHAQKQLEQSRLAAAATERAAAAGTSECPICLESGRTAEMVTFCPRVGRPCVAFYHRGCLELYKKHGGAKKCLLCHAEPTLGRKLARSAAPVARRCSPPVLYLMLACALCALTVWLSVLRSESDDDNLYLIYSNN